MRKTENEKRQAIRGMLAAQYSYKPADITDEMIDMVLAGLAAQDESVMNENTAAGLYQVTIDGEIAEEYPDGYLADQAAKRIFTSRAARGKIVTIRRSDGAVPYTYTS